MGLCGSSEPPAVTTGGSVKAARGDGGADPEHVRVELPADGHAPSRQPRRSPSTERVKLKWAGDQATKKDEGSYHGDTLSPPSSSKHNSNNNDDHSTPDLSESSYNETTDDDYVDDDERQQHRRRRRGRRPSLSLMWVQSLPVEKQLEQTTADFNIYQHLYAVYEALPDHFEMDGRDKNAFVLHLKAEWYELDPGLLGKVEINPEEKDVVTFWDHANYLLTQSTGYGMLHSRVPESISPPKTLPKNVPEWFMKGINRGFDLQSALLKVAKKVAHTDIDEDYFIDKICQQWYVLDAENFGIVTRPRLTRFAWVSHGHGEQEEALPLDKFLPADVVKEVEAMVKATGEKNYFTFNEFTDMILERLINEGNVEIDFGAITPDTRSRNASDDDDEEEDEDDDEDDDDEDEDDDDDDDDDEEEEDDGTALMSIDEEPEHALEDEETDDSDDNDDDTSKTLDEKKKKKKKKKKEQKKKMDSAATKAQQATRSTSSPARPGAKKKGGGERRKSRTTTPSKQPLPGSAMEERIKLRKKKQEEREKRRKRAERKEKRRRKQLEQQLHQQQQQHARAMRKKRQRRTAAAAVVVDQFDLALSAQYVRAFLEEEVKKDGAESKLDVGEFLEKLQHQWADLDATRRGYVEESQFKSFLWEAQVQTHKDMVGDDISAIKPALEAEVSDYVSEVMQATGGKGYFTFWDFCNLQLAETPYVVAPPHDSPAKAKAKKFLFDLDACLAYIDGLTTPEQAAVRDRIEQQWRALDTNLQGYVTRRDVVQFVWSASGEEGAAPESARKLPAEMREAVRQIMAGAGGKRDELSFWDFANVILSAENIDISTAR